MCVWCVLYKFIKKRFIHFYLILSSDNTEINDRLPVKDNVNNIIKYTYCCQSKLGTRSWQKSLLINQVNNLNC